ncbi:MAG: histidine phosphatase family protein [Anaerolineae bacterium]|nr:histidine phosphatase family protein [Anaerolineae bacterium]
MSLRLWLVRHGQSTWNAEGRIQGWADPPLSAHGQRQAEQVAGRLAAVELAAIYTSTLQRAAQTAQAIGEATGLVPIPDERFKEHGMGKATGHDWEWMIEKWPQLQEIASRGENIRPHIPGAEPRAVFNRRMRAAFAELREKHPTGDVAVVSHGGTFRAYLAFLMGVRDGVDPGLHFSNASLTLVEFIAPGWTDIRFVNETCHLRDGR